MVKKQRICRSKNTIVMAVIVGIILGLLAKLADSRQITSTFPIFYEVLGRFGIWIWVATLLAVFSKTPLHAAVRVFFFFISMLTIYYLYTVLFLGFFPKSQILLWGAISLITPVCGFVMWYILENKLISSILAALPLVALFTEWYYTSKYDLLILAVYMLMAIHLLMISPSIKQQLLILLFAVLMSFLFIQAGFLYTLYEHLLNV